MNWRRIFGICGTCAGVLVCGVALAATGANGTPAPSLNLSLPAANGLDGGERAALVAPPAPARSAFDAKIPDGHQANPICKNGVRSTSYQIVGGKMVYKCD